MMKFVNKVLYRPAKEVTDFKAAMRLAEQMLDHLRKTGDAGLAAPQIGVSKRLFVMNLDRPLIVINPTIISFSDKIVNMEEGCLSFPNKWVKLDRPDAVVVSFDKGVFSLNENGAVESPIIDCLPLSGLEARCFQHELDHLDGITMFHRLQQQQG